ncbi:hypothetical protein VPH35_037635 [Triticum aestivum]|uniref:Endonuclease/exonuclease/phosphatase domain-containing protein n=1 Tax=Aegilops tauschii subsp. strangulata TaxID=200361 RepID=A0A453BYC7_AEGTS
MDHGLKIIVWNVRGLNARARRTAIRSLIVSTDASIVCFQETKMEFIHMSTVLETLGSDFDDYVYLPAIGTRGGILLAWKSRMVTADNHMFSPNTLTTQVSTPSSADAPWWLTIVYGPQQDHEKIAFLQEIRDVRANCAGPWMLCGDFNLIYRDEDKNNGNINRRMMGRFRRVINDLALKEVYLNGRRYTWSNEQTRPRWFTSIVSSALQTGRSGTESATFAASPRLSPIIARSFLTARLCPRCIGVSISRSTGRVLRATRTWSRLLRVRWTTRARFAASCGACRPLRACSRAGVLALWATSATSSRSRVSCSCVLTRPRSSAS